MPKNHRQLRVKHLPYVAARVGFESYALRTKGDKSTNEPRLRLECWTLRWENSGSHSLQGAKVLQNFWFAFSNETSTSGICCGWEDREMKERTDHLDWPPALQDLVQVGCSSALDCFIPCNYCTFFSHYYFADHSYCYHVHCTIVHVSIILACYDWHVIIFLSYNEMHVSLSCICACIR